MRSSPVLLGGLLAALCLPLSCAPTACGPGTSPDKGTCVAADDDPGVPDPDEEEDDTDEPDDTNDTDETDPDEESISEDALEEVADAIAASEAEGWPDAGGPVEHHLPFAEGIHMGISQGTDCGGHAGSLEGSIDFTISGNYESSHGISAVASAAGTVVIAVTTVTGYVAHSYGNYVVLRHPDGTHTLYGHLAYGHVDVAVGDEVCAGQPLGLIGSTGESSGEHLHYEQRDAAQLRLSPTFADLDPVPSSCTPCTTSTHESGCYESGNEYLECDDDTTIPAGDCWIEASPDTGTWTDDFTPDASCTCSDSEPSCHSLYRGRVDAIDGNTVTLSVEKATGGGPSVDVRYWVGVGEDTEPSCMDIDAFVSRDDGTWSSGDDVLEVRDVSVWPSASAFEDAEPGDTKKLLVITGGSDGPSERTWFQREALVFTKVCD